MNLLFAILIGQLIGSGVTFSISSAVLTRTLQSQEFRADLPSRFSSSCSRRIVCPFMTFSPPMTTGDSMWKEHNVDLSPISFSKLAAAPAQSRSASHDLESAAALSSKLTLDFYFSNIQKNGNGGALRFDEISSHSPRRLLLRFVAENDLTVKVDDADASTGVLYGRILSAWSEKDGSQLGGKSKRVNPLVEYGQLRPMPKNAQRDDEMVSLTQEVLEAYGIKREDHLHFSLTNVLEAMQIEYQTDFTIHNGQIHMDVILSGECDGQKIVVSALDRECFQKGTREVNAHLELKKKSLKGMGFQVVTVPFFDWQKLTTKRQRVAYIAGKLSRAGYWGGGGGFFGKSGTVVKRLLRDTY